MSHPKPLPARSLLAPLAPSVLLAALLLAAATPDTVLNEREVKALAKEVKGYFDAKQQTKGILEAFAKVSEAIDKTQKRLKDRDALAQVADWRAVFFEARSEGFDERGLKKGKIEERTVELSSEAVHYWLYLPAKYSAKTGPYRLLITVPDKGETPEAHLAAEWLDPAQRETTIIACPRMPSNTRSWTAFDPSGALDGVSSIMHTFGSVFGQLSVDVDHVFLAGKGLGMAAAIATARAFPHRFTGVIGRGAAPEELVPLADFASNCAHVPTLLVDAGAHATSYEARAKELGVETCKHEQGKTEADLWAWMGQLTRDPYPKQLDFRPPTPYTTSAYWLELVGINVDEKPAAKASVDREANAITIDAQNVSTVKVFFNDALLDLDKPVKVVVNGVEHQQLIARNNRIMIDLVFDGGDWGRIFTAFMPFDVQAKSN